MAEEVAIQGSPEGAVAKIRSPLGVALLMLTIVYIPIWWYKVNKEMAEYGRAHGTGELGTNPTTSVLAIVPGFIVLIPPLVSYYNGWSRLKAAGRLAGRTDEANGWIAVLLYFVIGIAFPAYFQSDLNKTWEAQAHGGGGALPTGTAAETPAAAQTHPEQTPGS